MRLVKATCLFETTTQLKVEAEQLIDYQSVINIHFFIEFRKPCRPIYPEMCSRYNFEKNEILPASTSVLVNSLTSRKWKFFARPDDVITKGMHLVKN